MRRKLWAGFAMVCMVSFILCALAFLLMTTVESTATEAPPNGKLLHQYIVRDPSMNNMLAWAFIAPADWKWDGGVHCVFSKGNAIPNWWTQLSVHSADGLPETRMFRDVSFAYHNNAATRYFPAKVSGLPPMGPEVFITKWILPHWRQGIMDMRIIGSADVPELTKLVRMHCNAKTQVRSARVMVEYTEHGRTVEEMVFCAVRVPPTISISRYRTINWYADGFSYRAEKGKLDAAGLLLATIANSLIRIPKWEEACNQLRLRGLKQQIKHGQDLVNISKQISRNQDEERSMLDEIYKTKSRAQAKQARDFSDNTFDRQRMVNPNTGKKMTVGIGSSYYYQNNNSDKVYGSDRPPNSFIPNSKMSVTELKKDNSYP